jgi:hypothetical protein
VNNTEALENNTNQAITNTVRVGAESGDALVAENTSAGNARSGDATASVNIMNMINNSISLDGWFGILFINVFGTWQGSFGIDTIAGNPVPVSNPVAEAAQNSDQAQMFRFVSTSLSGTGNRSSSSPLSWYTYADDGTAVAEESTSSPGTVLASHITRSPLAKVAAQTPDAIRRNVPVMILGSILAGAILLFGERHRIFRRHYNKLSA